MGLQHQSGVTPLFSIRTASSQRCGGIDTDAWCRRDLNEPLMCKVSGF